MAVFPATDIVMDVAQAADPGKRDVALKRLSAASATSPTAAQDFGATFSGAFPPASLNASSGAMKKSVSFANMSASGASGGHAMTAAQKFEAFVLQTFIETMLPKEGGAAFGHDAGAGVWRSMMAEQLGNQIAKAGGIGLQKVLAREMRAHAPSQSQG
jgi:peptidoglycan hydrolase FlgJ